MIPILGQASMPSNHPAGWGKSIAQAAQPNSSLPRKLLDVGSPADRIEPCLANGIARTKALYQYIAAAAGEPAREDEKAGDSEISPGRQAPHEARFMPQGSITHWLTQIDVDRELATSQLWRRFRHRLLGLARQALENAPRRLADEEDLASVAFAEVFRGAERERFPHLTTRDDLWRILACVIVRRARDYRRRAQVRRKIDGEGGDAFATDRLPASVPSAEAAAELADSVDLFIVHLEDERLRRTALLKLRGHTNLEIARITGCIERTVERRMAVIRRRWTELAGHERLPQ